MARRAQRQVCAVCGRSVAVLDDQTLISHLSRAVAGTPYTPRCRGGALPPTDGLIRAVVEDVPEPVNPPADRTVNSIRTLRGGLPSLGRR